MLVAVLEVAALAGKGSSTNTTFLGTGVYLQQEIILLTRSPAS